MISRKRIGCSLESGQDSFRRTCLDGYQLANVPRALNKPCETHVERVYTRQRRYFGVTFKRQLLPDDRTNFARFLNRDSRNFCLAVDETVEYLPKDSTNPKIQIFFNEKIVCAKNAKDLLGVNLFFFGRDIFFEKINPTKCRD